MGQEGELRPLTLLHELQVIHQLAMLEIGEPDLTLSPVLRLDEASALFPGWDRETWMGVQVGLEEVAYWVSYRRCLTTMERELSSVFDYREVSAR